MSEWISVKKKLPDSVDDYLVQMSGPDGIAKFMDVKTFLDGRFMGVSCGFVVTHWQTLPAPSEGA